MVYNVSGRGGAITISTANACHGALWNPHATRRIKVLEVALFIADFDVAGESWYLQVNQARGTPGSTVTPDADNSNEADSAPPSGALLDLAEYTVAPSRSVFPSASLGPLGTSSGGGFHLPIPRGIILPPGRGIGIFFRIGATFSGGADVSFVFED